MHRRDAKAFLPLVQALSEGKIIQFLMYPGVSPHTWGDADDVVNFTDSPNNYRVKPEPKWRPWSFRDAPHYLVVALKDSNHLNSSTCWDSNAFLAQLTPNLSFVVHGVGTVITPQKLLNDFLQIKEDGTTFPCGVLEQP